MDPLTLIGLIIGIIAGLIAILEKSFHFLPRKHKTPIKKKEALLVVDRFVELFKAHGIERTQIPRFLAPSYKLTLADVSSNGKLLPRLDETILSAVCELFGVQREWLDKGCVSIYQDLPFYSDMKSYIDFLFEITNKYDEVRGFAIKSPEDKLKKDGSKLPIALLFKVRIGMLGNDPIYKYYFADREWFWNYDRTRIQLKTMFFAAFQFQIYICGCELPKNDIENLIKRRVFPDPLLNDISCVKWRPDEYICTTEESPVAIDSEEALKAREYMTHTGWIQKLEKMTGKKAEFSLRQHGGVSSLLSPKTQLSPSHSQGSSHNQQ